MYEDLKTQCSSCGLRFKERGEKSRQHADWHYQQNRLKKQREKKPKSRQWFDSPNEWIQQNFDESKSNNIVSTNIQNIFKQCKNENNSNMNKNCTKRYSKTSENEQNDIESCNDIANICVVCNEEFEEYWSNKRDCWLWKNARYLNLTKQPQEKQQHHSASKMRPMGNKQHYCCHVWCK